MFLTVQFNPPQNVNNCDPNCDISESFFSGLFEAVLWVASTIGFCISALLFMFGGVSICLCKKVNLLRHGLKNSNDFISQKAAQYLRENFI